jgi:hypothetical protein
MLSEPIAVTLVVIDVFEQLGVDYVIGGSLASARHGMARATMDSDLVADLRFDHIKPLVHQLEGAFYVDENAVRNAIERYSSFNLIHLETMFKVDVFIPKPRPFDHDQIMRGEKQIVATDPERTAKIATAEDTILAKLEWYRLGGEVSERQWRDVLSIISVQAERLDEVYLRQQADALGVVDLLERVFNR